MREVFLELFLGLSVLLADLRYFFRERFPRTSLRPELPMVVDGNITTANSIRAGIDMALYLVAQIYGQTIAREAARQMEYPYPDDHNFRARKP